MASIRLETNTGPLIVEDDGCLLKARGVPYAYAKRFTAPTPVSPQSQARDATRRGPQCPQLPSRLDFVTGPTTAALVADEQCLVLSVTAPRDADGLPVMVWFHGGAYMSGSGEAPKYDPDALAAEGRVVVVTVTYRLGIFGYLNLVPGGEPNLGLLDQILALRWASENIAAFGGDPARVTIFGQSAGADSVLSLICCPQTAGLFTRAILHSAPLGLPSERSEMTAAMLTAATAALGGCAPGDASVAQLLQAQSAAVTAAQRFGQRGGLPFGPVAGAHPLPARHDVGRTLAQRAPGVELLVGYTRLDAAPFVALDRRARKLHQTLGVLGDVTLRLVAALLTRKVFGRPAHRLAKTWRANGGAAATFRVDWSPPGAPLGPCHCIDLPLLLGSPESWSDATMLGHAPNPIDIDIARRLRAQWAAFAHHGIDALNASALRI